MPSKVTARVGLRQGQKAGPTCKRVVSLANSEEPFSEGAAHDRGPETTRDYAPAPARFLRR